MFRRHWSGLPKDACFPSDLEALGYFINDDDEIRSTQDPDYYFKYFLDRNARINDRQRFALNHALENIIHERLESHGLVKTPLPLGTPFSQTHVPIFVDASLETKSRVVVVFGEASKFLGLLAGRVATGRGGVNKGSMVSVVEELHRQRSSPDDRGPPGVVLANIGELYWWPEGKRSLTLGDSSAIPLPSLVHRGWNFMPGINYIRGNETPERHVQCVFDQTLQNLVNEKALLDVVAIGDTCGIVERFLDEENNWNAWGHRLSSILLMDPFRDVEKLSNPSIKEFLAKRCRCYLRSSEPVDTPLAGPDGNTSLHIPAFGWPCYSSSELNYTECALIAALQPALGYLERNALEPTAENEPITVAPRDPEGGQGEVDQEVSDAVGIPEVEVFDKEILEKQRKQAQMWRRFEETGEALEPDLEDSGVRNEEHEAKSIGE